MNALLNPSTLLVLFYVIAGLYVGITSLQAIFFSSEENQKIKDLVAESQALRAELLSQVNNHKK